MVFVIIFLFVLSIIVSILVWYCTTHKLELTNIRDCVSKAGEKRNNLCDTCDHCITICGKEAYNKYHTDDYCPLGNHDTTVEKCKRYEVKETRPSTK